MDRQSFEALKASCKLLHIQRLAEETMWFFHPKEKVKEVVIVAKRKPVKEWTRNLLKPLNRYAAFWLI
jgi:hypothetical protein